jgi:hypothetical protein
MKKGDKKQQKASARRNQAKRERAALDGQWSQEIAAIHHARTYPIAGCWVQPGWQENGLAVVVVARRQPDGRLVLGNYEVDYYCLGVKNCFGRGNVSLDWFEKKLLPKVMPDGVAEPIAPALAHELIYGSIAYAARWGFAPHPDFEFAQEVLDAPALRPQGSNVTFGKDGKPFFISGPNDDAGAVVAQLERSAGAGNFAYVPVDEALLAPPASETPPTTADGTADSTDRA